MPRLHTLTALLVAVLLLSFSTKTLAQSEDACEGYPKDQRIQRLGVHPFAKKPAADKAALAQAISEHEEELRAFLRSRGLDEVADALIDALKSGDGVTERALTPGETFQWMLFREKGALTAGGPRCLDTRKSYSAFEVPIRVRKVPADPPQPSCEFTASGDCEARTLSVDASNASDGVVITMKGGGGSQTVISDGKKSWEGEYENRFRSTYSFEAKASRPVTGTETTYTFVIPKACVNVALAEVEEREIELDPTTCSAKETVEPCPAPDPSCTLTLSDDKVRPGQQIEINATGHWDTEGPEEGLRLEVSDGTVLGPELPAYYDAETVGLYTVTCTATNEAGDTATDTATFEVARRPWTVRFFGSAWRTDDEIADQSMPSPTVLERSKTSTHSGEGAGVSIEYHVREKIGLEAALLVGSIDSRFTLDINELWGHDDDEFGIVALTFGPNFHLTPDSRVDFYIGPFVGFASIDEPTFNTLGRTVEVDADDEFVFGAQLGLDVPFKPESAWGLHFGLRYMGLEAGELDLDPFVGSVGLSYRF